MIFFFLSFHGNWKKFCFFVTAEFCNPIPCDFKLQPFIFTFFRLLFQLILLCVFCWCRENVLNSQYKGIPLSLLISLSFFHNKKKCCKSLCNYGQFTALQMYTKISQMNFNWLMVNHEKKSYTLFWAMLFIYLFHLESAWKKITKMARCGTKEPE